MSDQQAPESLSRDGVGVTRETAENETLARRQEYTNKQAAIVAAAREKLKADFRTSQGVPAPAPAPESVETATPPANPSQLADTIAQKFQSQFDEASKLRLEAEKIRGDSESRAAQAEAKLQKFLANPIAFLEEQKLSPDDWQARLMNGGEPTEQEKLKAQIAAQYQELRKEAMGEVAQIKQELMAEKKSKAISDLTPVLTKDFPLVSKLLGAEGALDYMRQEVQKTGKPIDPAAFLAKVESGFVHQYQETLRDEKVASKLGLSVNKSPQVEVVADKPRTLSNRVTSSVPPQAIPRAGDAKARIAQGRSLLRQLIAEGKL